MLYFCWKNCELLNCLWQRKVDSVTPNIGLKQSHYGDCERPAFSALTVDIALPVLLMLYRVLCQKHRIDVSAQKEIRQST